MSGVYEEPRILKPGDRFRGYPYVVESFIGPLGALGEGTSGQVFAIRHEGTGDRFALEVCPLAEPSAAHEVARRLAEAKATYGIRHPNIVRIFDLGVEDDGMVWQIREILDASSVADLLAREGKLSPIYAIDIAVEVAHGLQAAHEQEASPRDIQPSNVFVTAAGRVAVHAFSLAKLIPSGFFGAKGSKAYMSPEHITGATPTEQFDVYALGLMLWQMIVGRHPFESALHDATALVRAHLEEDPPSLAHETGLPAYCDEVIHDATAKDPTRRTRGMWTFARALYDLRERLLVDPAAAPLLRDPPEWERQTPIARDPKGHQQYRAPSSLPSEPSTSLIVPPVLLDEAPKHQTPPIAMVATLESAVETGEPAKGETPKPADAKRAIAVTMPMSVFVLPAETTPAVSMGETPKPPVPMGDTPKPPVPMGDTPKPPVSMGETPKPPARPAQPVETAQKRRPVPPAPVSVSEGPITVDAAAPTVRAPRAPLSRWIWAAIVAIPLLIAAGVCLWVFVIDKPLVETKPRPPVVAPKATARPKQR